MKLHFEVPGKEVGMNCDKCGKDFPSQYYLDFNKVPGVQLCRDCVAEISPADIAELRTRFSVAKRPTDLAPDQYAFPDKCCSCMGCAETEMTVWAQRNMGTVMQTISVQVPVCWNCSKREKVPNYFIAGGICLGGLIGVVAGGIPGLIGCGVIGSVIGALVGYLATKIAAPASITMSGAISFRNPKYEALFKEANSRL